MVPLCYQVLFWRVFAVRSEPTAAAVNVANRFIWGSKKRMFTPFIRMHPSTWASFIKRKASSFRLLPQLEHVRK